jgi:hypothetical protein
VRTKERITENTKGSITRRVIERYHQRHKGWGFKKSLSRNEDEAAQIQTLAQNENKEESKTTTHVRKSLFGSR